MSPFHQAKMIYPYGICKRSSHPHFHVIYFFWNSMHERVFCSYRSVRVLLIWDWEALGIKQQRTCPSKETTRGFQLKFAYLRPLELGHISYVFCACTAVNDMKSKVKRYTLVDFSWNFGRPHACCLRQIRLAKDKVNNRGLFVSRE
jgi:hypothetical protein